MGELLVILAVALLFLGPKRLPDLASGIGKAIREFRKATRDLSDQIEVDESVRKPIAELKAALRDEPLPPDLRDKEKDKVEVKPAAGAIATAATAATATSTATPAADPAKPSDCLAPDPATAKPSDAKA